MAVVFWGVDGIVDWSLAFCIYLDKTFNGTLESHFSLELWCGEIRRSRAFLDLSAE